MSVMMHRSWDRAFSAAISIRDWGPESRPDQFRRRVPLWPRCSWFAISRGSP